jgi:hypothetical protein
MVVPRLRLSEPPLSGMPLNRERAVRRKNGNRHLSKSVEQFIPQLSKLTPDDFDAKLSKLICWVSDVVLAVAWFFHQ